MFTCCLLFNLIQEKNVGEVWNNLNKYYCLSVIAGGTSYCIFWWYNWLWGISNTLWIEHILGDLPYCFFFFFDLSAWNETFLCSSCDTAWVFGEEFQNFVFVTLNFVLFNHVLARTLYKKDNYLYFLLLYRACNRA